MRKRLHLLFFFQLAGLLLFAQAGALDLSFSGNGKQMTAVGTSFSYAWTVALQPTDQKILLAGTCVANLPGGTGYAIGVVRYLTNGAIDNTFGTNGRAIAGIVNRSLYPASILVLSNGNMLIAGRAGGNSLDTLFLTRLTATGFVDNTFGSAGWVFLPKYGGGSLSLQADGKIIVGGCHVEGSGDAKRDKVNLALLRFSADGTPDNTFGSGGSVITDAGGQDFSCGVALTQDGHIVLGGQRGSDTLLALRYTSAGALDPTFGVGGITAVTVGNPPQQCGAFGMTLQSDGKILLCGDYVTQASELDVLVLRLNENGTLDNSFAGNGKKGVSFGSAAHGLGVALETNGKIVVGVGATIGSKGAYGVCRLTTTGALDNTFGTNGIASYTWSGNGLVDAYAMAQQRNGQILVVGSSSDEFAAMRFLGSGTNLTATAEAVTTGPGNKFPASTPQDIQLFPNPATSQLQVTGLPADGPSLLTVTDMSGKISLQQRSAGGNVLLDISRLAPATYVLTISSATTQRSLPFIKSSR